MTDKAIPDLTAASTLTGAEELHVVQSDNSRRASVSAVSGMSMRIPPGARQTNLGTRGMWVPCIGANNTYTLFSGRIEAWMIWWCWEEPFDRFRYQMGALYTGGTTSLQVALFDPLSRARLAHWSFADAFSRSGPQTSPPLASPINPGARVLRLEILPQFTGGTGSPTLSATGPPIVPPGVFGSSLVSLTRTTNSAWLIGSSTSIGTSPAATDSQLNSNLPILPFDIA